ncbi:MAG TPA: GAF domain-containing protein, partial [Bacillota bacterium]|nr:GAF domain-containing protein [Bacillota bacterium]
MDNRIGQEEKLRQLNRTLKALRHSSQAMMRAVDEASYLQAVCQVVVEDCGHALIWIGFAEEDAAKTVRTVAHAGFDEGYIQALRISWADNDRGRGPTGTAIRTGKLSLCRDILTDERFGPWRQEALKRGYASSVVLPLLAQGGAFGALTIYSTQADAFADDELELLGQLAEDLAYGIRAIRLREAHARAEAELQETSKLKRMKQVLQHSEARYRSLVTATAQIVWMTNAQGEIVGELPAWQAFTGQTPQAYQGLGWTEAVHPEDRPRTMEVWFEAVGSRRLYETEYRLRHHDGQYRQVAVRGVPVLESDGSVREWVGTCTDITEAKAAERRRNFTNALLALFAQKGSSKEYLDSVVEVLRQWSDCQALGIRVTTAEQEIPYAAWQGFEPGFLELENRLSLQRDNCCCIRVISQSFAPADTALRTPKGSLCCDNGMTMLEELPPAQPPVYRGTCAKYGFASLAIIPIRYRDKVLGALHLADPRPNHFPRRTVEFIEAMAPLIGEAIHRFQAEAELATYRDHLEVLVRQRTSELEAANARLQVEISQRRRAQAALQETAQELERSNRDLEQFAYVASHDLQEPLRAVGGFVKLLQRRFPDKLDAKAREYITGAVEGATRMQTLITDLLTFSRVGTQGRAFARADLNLLLRDALENLQFSLQAAEAQVTHEPLPSLVVDATQVVQLFQNLIGNAIKFRAERPP